MGQISRNWQGWQEDLPSFLASMIEPASRDLPRKNRSARIRCRITGARAALPQNCPRCEFRLSSLQDQGNLGNRLSNRSEVIYLTVTGSRTGVDC
jgi:hypothetical protein